MSIPCKSFIATLQEHYKLLEKQGEGSFSEVFKAQEVSTGKYVAIKIMKQTFSSRDEAHNLGEIRSFCRLPAHRHIIELLDVFYDERTGKLALVFDLMHQNVYDLIKTRREGISEQKAKRLIYELLKALDHLHSHDMFHRDVKPENVLINQQTDAIKLADLGSCKRITSPQPYTEYISTRWYRPPECMLTDGLYGKKMDIWGAGCVLYEVLTLSPLFPGINEIDQIRRIHKTLGMGVRSLLPTVSFECVDLLEQLLKYEPGKRVSARQALRHSYFRDLVVEDMRTLACAPLLIGQPQKSQKKVEKPPALSESTFMSNSPHSKPRSKLACSYHENAKRSANTHQPPKKERRSVPFNAGSAVRRSDCGSNIKGNAEGMLNDNSRTSLYQSPGAKSIPGHDAMDRVVAARKANKKIMSHSKQTLTPKEASRGANITRSTLLSKATASPSTDKLLTNCAPRSPVLLPQERESIGTLSRFKQLSAGRVRQA